MATAAEKKVQRFDRNIRRLISARDLLEIAFRDEISFHVPDLDLQLCIEKLRQAEEKVRNARKEIVGA